MTKHNQKRYTIIEGKIRKGFIAESTHNTHNPSGFSWTRFILDDMQARCEPLANAERLKRPNEIFTKYDAAKKELFLMKLREGQ